MTRRLLLSAISAPAIRPTLRAAAQGLTLAVIGGLSACSTVSDALTTNKVDYRAAATTTTSLAVPPDLTQLTNDPRYQQPVAGAVVSAAAMQTTSPAVGTTAAAVTTVARQSAADVRIERAGNQRWLVTGLTPEQLWPVLRSFWQENGFALASDQPELGAMETDWTENRAKLPQDFIRRSIGKVLDGLYDSSQRDRYHTRVERGAQGTEIYISHRSVVEQLVGDRNSQNTHWIAGPNDPNLEAEFLGRLLIKLSSQDGATPRDAKTVTAAVDAVNKTPPSVPARARLIDKQAAATLQLDEGFDRAWRRVGLSLDRAGFTIEDRDRKAGIFDIRYVDPKFAGTEEPGFFARMLGKTPEGRAGTRYRIKVAAESARTERSLVTVLDREGAPLNDEGARMIVITMLNDLR